MNLKKVLLWGIGGEYNKNSNLISYYSNNQFDIIGITDVNPPKHSSIDSIKIISLMDLCYFEFDYILICSSKWYKEIMSEAISVTGLSSEKIFPVRVLSIPGFNFDKLCYISESQYSFISNNCWGGMLSYTLGIEGRSPFKNLSISDNDYLKLLSDFNNYMNLTPKFTGEWSYDNNSKKDVPMLELGDIKIKCNHYDNPQYAIKKWEERKRKINYNSLFFEMYTESREVANEFARLNLNGIKKCFVPFKTENNFLVYLPKQTGQNYFYETVNNAVTVNGKGFIYDIFSLFAEQIIYRIQ